MPENSNTKKKTAPAIKPLVSAQNKTTPSLKKKSTETVTISDDESSSSSSSSSSSGLTVSAIEQSESSSEEEEEESEKESEKGKEKEDAIIKEHAKSYPAYRPPPSFKLISSSTTTSSSENPFSASNLKGKELWFITAPIAAPLSKLETLDLKDVADGNPVVEGKNGRKYMLRAKSIGGNVTGEGEEENREEKLGGAEAGVSLVVGDKKGVYRIAGKPISKIFEVIETLPITQNINTSSIPKPVRQQPEGLKMRFRPIGSSSSFPEDSAAGDRDVKMTDATTTTPEKKKQRKEDRVNGSGGGEGEKRKKRRKSSGKEEGSVRKEKKHRSKEKGDSRYEIKGEVNG